MIYLAFKSTPAHDAGLVAKFAAWLIKARLVSQYCHGGIVIDDTLIHANAARGLHATADFEPGKWDLFPVDASEEQVLQRFQERAGKLRYDWFSLLAFVGFKASDSRRMYCFEWCYFALTGINPNFRVTPETLLSLQRAKLSK